MSDIEIKVFTKLEMPQVLEVEELDKEIFPEPMTSEQILKKLYGKNKQLSLIAYAEGKPCAFKVGFEDSSKRFYSWIGGVHPDFRGRGIAVKLMQKQHEILSEMSYKVVSTKTYNHFRSMLLLNIKYGFNVVGTKQDDSKDLQIILEKSLD